MAEYGPALPGMEPTPTPDGPLLLAARTTIQALRDAGLIEPRHEITVVVVERLARAVDRGLDSPKVSVATATLSKHLLDAIESLPQPTAPVGDAWAEFERKLAESVA